MNTLKIGVVGFSRNQFDKKAAILQLRNHLEYFMEKYPNNEISIVSGYTNMGVPKLAYQIADDLGLHTVGFSAKQALRVRSGVYPVKEEIIIGERFGDESEAFIQYIDILLRVGGGPQSRKEVEMFKELHQNENLSDILFEKEVDWYGN